MTEYYVGVFTRGGSLSDKIGGFDTREKAEAEMNFCKEFYQGAEYEYAIIEERTKIIEERTNKNG